MEISTFTLKNLDDFKKQALKWASAFDSCCCFDSNNYNDPYSAFDFLIAAGVKEQVIARHDTFSALQNFLDSRDKWSFGFFSYDLKNELEDLFSANSDELQFPALYFFEPLHLLSLKGDQLTITSPAAAHIYREISAISITTNHADFKIPVKSRMSREYYLDAVNKIRDRIRRGEIYEMNFCQEFFAKAEINPADLFLHLNKVSPSPFAVFFKQDNHYLLSATPERFLSKRGNKLISQPIKGTAKRTNDPEQDLAAMNNLRSDPKEQAENVMIVDLVRNDLTRCAVPGTVRVEELFGIYSFSQVHQMISTVVCEVNHTLPLTSIIKPLFPMGSMTGAPKVSAMQLIETYEQTKRGLFSGAAGYFAPGGDFDFNVVIRSLLYNAANQYLSFQAGSAITFDSVPEKEYEECLLKVAAIREVLGGNGK